ncbi:hypothetical protein JRQ81_005835 [Phrynocephalus forsythii]|uniref:Uncharacterized protein n=1 Tax=Phrynocephalus forsythii TaxID=171643 RepID=A0A9Q0Y4C0_9SAUR|nr:hypothetical protein JRQ81_005835 [Phrynocephalus forsythii]
MHLKPPSSDHGPTATKCPRNVNPHVRIAADKIYLLAPYRDDVSITNPCSGLVSPGKHHTAKLWNLVEMAEMCNLSSGNLPHTKEPRLPTKEPYCY